MQSYIITENFLLDIELSLINTLVAQCFCKILLGIWFSSVTHSLQFIKTNHILFQFFKATPQSAKSFKLIITPNELLTYF